MFIQICRYRCFTIINFKEGKIITRGLGPKDGCEEQGASLDGAVFALVKTLPTSLYDDAITHKCCSWACCNYNVTLANLSSPPTSHLNISAAGVVWPGSSGGFHTYSK